MLCLHYFVGFLAGVDGDVVLHCFVDSRSVLQSRINLVRQTLPPVLTKYIRQLRIVEDVFLNTHGKSAQILFTGSGLPSNNSNCLHGFINRRLRCGTVGLGLGFIEERLLSITTIQLLRFPSEFVGRQHGNPFRKKDILLLHLQNDAYHFFLGATLQLVSCKSLHTCPPSQLWMYSLYSNSLQIATFR
ncbi:hypothetical protein SDC9_116846 [bioreactor metagenome]|uniref:Uncharacterized protein n=1 Tax=bioreactor metagenome TaxID=1076179 RepID=A0A645BXR2_9ZZZZ